MPYLACAGSSIRHIDARPDTTRRWRMLLLASSSSLALTFAPAANSQTVDANGVSGTVLVNVTLNAPAGSTAVLARNPGGGITLTGGDVRTQSSAGAPTIGLLAHTRAVINSSANVTSTGDYGNAVQAGSETTLAAAYEGSSAGAIQLTGGRIQTDGAQSTGLHTLDSGVINASNVVVSASGAGAYGAHAQSMSAINLNSIAITASGAASAGLIASNERSGIDPLAAGGVIDAASVTITAAGEAAHGVVARDGGRIALSGGTVTTSGAGGFGLFASATSRITSSSAVSTQGDNGVGALASHDGVVSLTGGSVTTTGVESHGLLARNGGSIDSVAGIATSGNRAAGVQAGASGPGASIYDGATAGVASLTGGLITTAGGEAPGFRAYDGGRINAGNAQVRTSGLASFGAQAETNSLIVLDHTQFTTSGAAADGLRASNSRRRDGIDLTATGGVIRGHASVRATGADAHAAVAEHGGRLELAGGVLTAEGSNAAGLLVSDHGVALIDNTAITSTQDIAVRSHNGAFVALSGGSTIVRGASAAMGASFSLPNQRADFLVGPGVQLSSTGGVLLAVDRSGSGGDSGIVALALGNGSQAAGDILDTGIKTTGFTDVAAGERAVWEGVARGVRHVVALHGGAQLYFRDGSAIRGDITTSNATLRFGDNGAAVAGRVALGDRSFSVGGSLASPVLVQGEMTVDASSHQAGNWRIHGNLTNHGIIAPGSSPGVIRTDGDLHLAASTVYQTDITADGRSDLISVGGRANLAGRVSVYPELSGGYLVDHRYTIVTAAGGLGGSVFEGGASWADARPYVFVTPTLVYDANNAYLTVVRNGTPMEEAAKTPNEAAVAGAVDRLPKDDSLFTPVANLPTAGAASTAFRVISGDVYASLAGAMADDSRHVREALNGRLLQAFNNPTSAANNVQTRSYDGLGATLWGQVFGAWGHSSAANSASAKVERSSAGFLTGADAAISDVWRLGVAGGYGRSALDSGQRLSSASVDNYHLALYGGGAFGALSLRSGAAYSWNVASVRRHVTFSGFAESVSGAHRSGVTQIFGEAGYQTRTGPVTAEPYLNIAWAGLNSDVFREAGRAAALSGKTGDMSTAFTTLGARIAQSFPLGNGAALTARGVLGWRHAFGDVNPRSWMALSGGAAAFNVTGVPIASNSLLLETGLDMHLASNVSLGATWSGQFAERAQDQSFRGNVAVRF